MLSYHSSTLCNPVIPFIKQTKKRHASKIVMHIHSMKNKNTQGLQEEATYEAEDEDAEGADSVQDKADAKVFDMSDTVDGVP